MKMLLLGLLFTSNVFSQTRESLDNHGWLIVNCHDENKESSFEISISSDELNNVRQITSVSFNGKIKNVLESDTKIVSRPLVGLATVSENNLQVYLRYESGLMWDTNLEMSMIYSDTGYRTQVLIKGDEGDYLNENRTFQCSIGNHGKVYLQTKFY